ncbi:MAG: type II toxin-antitoxin system RelE/ParE family toxin [Ruminococcus sp.]|nr:type II toxin-antitoxin system RelE/ParE family toxin [Ruminococcus sp.]
MYKVVFLPVAKQDLREIALYISNELCNPTAAVNLVDEIVEATENLSTFPYSHQVYYPIRSLKKEYRKFPIKNYMIFYTVDEQQKNVTVSRIIYAKRNLNSQITD